MRFQKKLPKLLRVEREWSPLQEIIFDDIKNGVGNTIIEAKPGSGKSATMIEGAFQLSEAERKDCIFLAFGKRDQQHLSRSLPNGVISDTTHALGYKLVRSNMDDVELDVTTYDHVGKDDRIANGYYPYDIMQQKSLAKCVSLCKAELKQSPEEIYQLVLDKHLHFGESIEEFIEKVQSALVDHENEVHNIGYDDMIWFPHRFGFFPARTYGRVLTDEMQDLSFCQLDLISKYIGGRLIGCLDSHQVCFSFRGAIQDTNVIKSGFQTKTLDLSVSYRCAKKIVELAQELVPDIQFAEQAEEGDVSGTDFESLLKHADVGDMILSRYNYPLVKLCMQLLSKGKAANIQGRDMSYSFLWMIKQSNANNFEEFAEWLETWREENIQIRQEKKASFEYIEDKYQSMQNFMEGCNTLSELSKRIKIAFKDIELQEKTINLCSIHRSKGREAKRVWLLYKTCKPEKNQEEENLYYIGITRAQQQLLMVA